MIWLLLLVVALLAAVLALLHRPPVQQRLLAELLPRLEERLGRGITVGELRFALFPTWIELRDVAVAGPQPAAPPIVTARRVYLQVEARDLLESVVTVQEVRAEGVEVYLHRFAEGGDNFPRPGRRARGSGRFQLDVEGLHVTDSAFVLEEDRLPMELTARGVRASLAGLGDAVLQGKATVESVDLTLPRARRYRGSVAATVLLQRDGLRFQGLARAPEARVRALGEVVWRGDKRVDLDIEGDVSAALFEELGYLDPGLVEGWATVDGHYRWHPGVWGYRGGLRAESLRLLDWRLRDVEGVVAGDRNAVWVEIDDSAYGGGRVQGQVEVDLRGAGQRTALSLALLGVDLETFLRDSDVPVERVAGRIDGTLDFRFADTAWRRGDGWGDFRVRGTAGGGRRLPVSGTLPLVIEGGRVSSHAVRLLAPDQAATGSFGYHLERQRGTIAYEIQSRDLGPLARLLPVVEEGEPWPLWLPTAGSGEIAGALHLAPAGARSELRLALRDAVAPGLSAQRVDGSLTVSPEAVEDLRLELSREGAAMLVRGTFPLDDRAPWVAELDVASWPLAEAAPWLPVELPVSGPFTGSVTLGGRGEETWGEVSGDLSPARVEGLEVERLRAQLQWRDGLLEVAQLSLSDAGGELLAAGTYDLEAEGLDFTFASPGVSLGGAPLGEWLGGQLGGEVELVGTLGGTWEQPVLLVEAVGRGVTREGLALRGGEEAAVRIGWRDSALTAEGSLLGLVTIAGGGYLDRQRADLAFTVYTDDLATLAAMAGELPEIAGTAEGSLTVRGDLARGPDVALELTRLAAEIGGHPLVNREPVEVRLLPEAVEIRSLYLVEEEGESEVFVSGRVGLGEDHPLDLRIQSTLANRWLDPWLEDFELTGYTDLLATVRGSVAEPLVNGQAEVRDARLLAFGFGQTVEELRAILLFYPDAVVIDSLRGEVGGGELRASGRVRHPFAAEGPDARVQIAARRVSLRYPEGWLLRGDADLTWSVDGAAGQVVRGLVSLDRAAYLRDVEVGVLQLLQRFLRRQRQEAGEADEELSDVQIDLVVQAPGTVRIRNNLADLSGSADLTARGSLARPVLFGRVEIEPGGTLIYAENEYTVERGTLTFANPYRVEPLVDLVATTEVANYDVTLNLFGNLERLNTSFTSDPPLPDLEVLSLLLSGAPSQLAEGGGDLREDDSGASAAEGMLFGQASSLISQRVGTLFGVDAFRIQPLSRSGDTVSNARFTVGKRLSKDVYVTYSYDPSSTEEQRLQVEWQTAEGFKVLLSQEGEAYAVDLLWEQRF
ncbi:MAG TPA: translocation/assembly module TamB domain-containing protein [Thermoanaerobaculia bacterium]|nr:translocation/assembly module TamB domain-containing protein [Thermoanaerobaculia bacterium]